MPKFLRTSGLDIELPNSYKRKKKKKIVKKVQSGAKWEFINLF